MLNELFSKSETSPFYRRCVRFLVLLKMTTNNFGVLQLFHERCPHVPFNRSSGASTSMYSCEFSVNQFLIISLFNVLKCYYHFNCWETFYKLLFEDTLICELNYPKELRLFFLATFSRISSVLLVALPAPVFALSTAIISSQLL